MAVNDQVIENDYALYNGDCIEVMGNMPDEKIHLSIYSPPFGGMYHYSSNDRDISNSTDYAEFFEHYKYCVQELFRITMPGRITAVHCTDIPGSNSGKDCLTDFPGDIIRLHSDIGFDFIARHTIWKEPLWVRNRTMTKNLSHMTTVVDAAYAGVASADYLLVFRKRGLNPVPIENPTGYEIDYPGGEPMPADILKYRGWEGDQKQNRYSHWIWRRLASSVWDDIRMGHVLPFQDCKDPDDEKHVHPLQLDIIARCIHLRSKVGETVFTPFMGVGSEVYGAVVANRKGVGVELKQSYFRQAKKNLELAHLMERPGQVDLDFD